MATKITQDKIIEINNLYFSLKTYAAVARQLGISPSTVKKYVIKDWEPKEVEERKFSGNIKEVEEIKWPKAEELNKLCTLSKEEIDEIKILWRELSI